VTLAICSPTLADSLELMFVSISFITIPIIVISYVHINKSCNEVQRLAMECGEKDNYMNQQLREMAQMGDRAPDFRYMI